MKQNNCSGLEVQSIYVTARLLAVCVFVKKNPGNQLTYVLLLTVEVDLMYEFKIYNCFMGSIFHEFLDFSHVS